MNIPNEDNETRERQDGKTGHNPPGFSDWCWEVSVALALIYASAFSLLSLAEKYDQEVVGRSLPCSAILQFLLGAMCGLAGAIIIVHLAMKAYRRFKNS